MNFAFTFILLASFCLNESEQKINLLNVSSLMETIPFEDQKEIKILFRDLFYNQSLAYSLFSDKPMSFSDRSLFKQSSISLIRLLSIEGYCQSVLEPYCEPSNLLNKRWEIWNKYESRFNLKKYLFANKKIGKQVRIFLINKEAFLKVINENLDLFKQVIGNDLSAEKLLEEIAEENTNVWDLLHNHEGLLGILLGFGRYNAMLFQEREKLLDKLEIPIISDKSIQEKIQFFNHLLKPLHQHDAYLVASINRVGFVADSDHPETTKLRNKYDELNRRLNALYAKEDWFEQTLLQLLTD